jgi:hypothetical protein
VVSLEMVVERDAGQVGLAAGWDAATIPPAQACPWQMSKLPRCTFCAIAPARITMNISLLGHLEGGEEPDNALRAGRARAVSGSARAEPDTAHNNSEQAPAPSHIIGRDGKRQPAKKDPDLQGIIRWCGCTT